MSEPQDRTDAFSADNALEAGLAAGFGKASSSVLRALSGVQLHDPDSEASPIVLAGSDQMPKSQDPADKYQLLGEIARGGMGCVLKGRDVDLKRDVAVKVLLEQHAGRTELLQRFVEEAQIAGQLQHPNIVPVYDFGELEGRPYFSMKLVKGQTLAKVLASRANPGQDQAGMVQVFLQVCQAVAFAHARGVIHRDLKPANVMMGGYGEVLVMDWGLAKVLKRGGVADERLRPEEPATEIRTARSGSDDVGSDTQAGSVLGTPQYMAPEQARGEVALVDERADVFGLGAVLCEILTGQPPFVGRNAEAMRKAQAAALEDAEGRLSRCGADAELVDLTRRCLAKEPWGRPPDAKAVADAVTAHLGAVAERLRQAELQRAAAEAKASEERKRQRVTLALAASLLGLVTLGGGAGTWWHQQRQETAREVEAALAEAEGHLKAGRWPEANAAVQRAEGRLGRGGSRHLRDRVDQTRRDGETVAELEDVRMMEADRRGGRSDWRAVDARYAKAFGRYGIGLDALAHAEATRRIREAVIREDLIVALDHWWLTTDAGNPRRDALRAVADAADGDAWRTTVRQAMLDKDGKRLTELAARPEAVEQPATHYYLIGAALRSRGLEPEAEQVLRRGQLRSPGDFWLNHELGRSLYQREVRLDEAAGFLRAALAARPTSPRAWQNLGAGLVEQGATDEAIACFQKALEIEPKYAIAHSNLGAALKAMGKADEAIGCIRKALELDPEYALAHTNLGDVLYAKGKADEAIGCFRKALDLDPKLALAHSNLGVALKAKGKADEAIGCYRKALELDPKNALALVNLGVALKAKGKADEAIGCLQKAIALKPKNATAHFNLGGVLAGKGDMDEAIGCYRKAIDLDPGNAKAHAGLGAALTNKGKADEAINSYRKALDLDPKDASAYTSLGVALFAKGQADEAIGCFRKALDLDPKDAVAYTGLGFALADKGKADEAIGCYRKALELKPKNALAHVYLGDVLYAKGKADEAIACFRKALDLDPKLAVAHAGLGMALAGKGKADEAIGCFRTALALDPKLALTQVNLGAALYAKGRVDEAIGCYQKALEIDPKVAAAHTELGVALFAKGKADEAIGCFRTALALDPRDAKAHYGLGRTLYAQGKADVAIGCYEKAIAIDPRFAEAHCNRGHILRDQGRFAEALASLKRGHELGSKQPGWAYPSAEWVRTCQRLVDLDARLPDVLAGKKRPADVGEALEFARLCLTKSLYAASAGLFADAFAADPRLASSLDTLDRYNAGCAAALAAAGQGKDAATLPAGQRHRWRRQALTWLAADLGAWGHILRRTQAVAPQLRETLQHWLADADLATVRDAAHLTKYGPEERDACLRLWADVRALLAQAAPRP